MIHVADYYPAYTGDGGGRMCASETLPGVAGEWWWASNECASLPKEGPLGPVLKQGHSRMWVMRWATVSKCSDVTRFGTCVAVPGCRKIDKMLMERVYGGHIMVHHPWGNWLLGQCVYVGTSKIFAQPQLGLARTKNHTPTCPLKHTHTN